MNCRGLADGGHFAPLGITHFMDEPNDTFAHFEEYGCESR